MRGVLPNITLPTRISETACTLIDNVITTLYLIVFTYCTYWNNFLPSNGFRYEK